MDSVKGSPVIGERLKFIHWCVVSWPKEKASCGSMGR